MARQPLTAEERDERRGEVLAAAHRLYRESGELPAVAAIAAAAGLAKGTVYLYFRSKEEIFVALLEDDFTQLLAAVADIVAALPAESSEAASRFAASFVPAVTALPDLLPLAALASAQFEQHLPGDALRRFKVGLAAGLDATGQALERRFPQLRSGDGAALLMHSWALTLGLWQALNYPASLRALLQEAELRILDRDFSSELTRSLTALWRGHLAPRN